MDKETKAEMKPTFVADCAARAKVSESVLNKRFCNMTFKSLTTLGAAGFKAEGREKKTAKFEKAFLHFPKEICKTLLKLQATLNSSQSCIIKEIWPQHC